MSDDVKASESISESVYAKLKYDILHGHLAPGKYLVERVIAERYGASRTPVREAFGRLAQEGLLTHDPRRRVQVCRITLEEVKEVYAIRELLEGLIARCATENFTEEDFSHMEQLLTRMRAATECLDLDALTDLNTEFHAFIKEKAEMPFLNRMLDTVWDRITRFRGISLAHPDRAPQTYSEHEWLYACFRSRSPYDAEREMRTHIRRAALIVLDILESNGLRSVNDA